MSDMNVYDFRLGPYGASRIDDLYLNPMRAAFRYVDRQSIAAASAQNLVVQQHLSAQADG